MNLSLKKCQHLTKTSHLTKSVSAKSTGEDRKMANFMVPHPDFIYMQSELADKSSTVLESSQHIINTAKFCFEDTGKYVFFLRVKISIHGGKHHDVILSPLTSNEAFPLTSVELEFLLRSSEVTTGEYF